MVCSLRHGWFLFLLWGVVLPSEADIPARTPSDVYYEVERLRDQVVTLRLLNGIQGYFQSGEVVSGKAPRHVLQKGLEVLEKINRLRGIYQMGEISISPYPSRTITPNEVYDLAVRLVREMVLVVQNREQHLHKRGMEQKGQISYVGDKKSPSDVYYLLRQISDGLDPLVGVRGFTLAEVYAQTEQLLEMVWLIRRSQNLYDPVEPPERKEGQFVNYAMQKVNQFNRKLADEEYNLWMVPMDVRPVPRRKITPTDLYDLLQNSIAELQQMKYRLGLERTFSMPEPEPGRTIDDVVYNIELALRLLPDFQRQKRIQFDQQGLKKRPEQVYAVVNHIIQELVHYQRRKGVPPPAHQQNVRTVERLEPRHTYYRSIEVLRQISRVRQQHGLGELTVPDFPNRTITPSEVYEMALRIDRELELIYQRGGADLNDFGISHAENLNPDFSTPRTPSDVYQHWGQVAHRLTQLAGGEAESDIVQSNHRVRQLLAELLLIADARGVVVDPVCCAEEGEAVAPLRPLIVAELRKVGQQLHRLKQRTGLLTEEQHHYPNLDKPELSWVSGELGLLLVNSWHLKQYLGISQSVESRALRKLHIEGGMKLQVYRGLQKISGVLQQLLGTSEESRES